MANDRDKRRNRRKRVRKFQTGGRVGLSRNPFGGAQILGGTRAAGTVPEGDIPTVGGNIGTDVGALSSTTLGNLAGARTSFPQIGEAAQPLGGLGGRLATSPVSGDVASQLRSQNLQGQGRTTLNDILATGAPTDVSPITAAAQQAGLQTFGDISDQIAQQMAATGGLDSSARVAALARAGQRIGTDIGLEGLRAGVGAQEAAAGRRLAALDPAVAELGISADALGRLGQLEQQGFSNAISALGAAGGLTADQARLEAGAEQTRNQQQLAATLGLADPILGAGSFASQAGAGAFPRQMTPLVNPAMFAQDQSLNPQAFNPGTRPILTRGFSPGGASTGVFGLGPTGLGFQEGGRVLPFAGAPNTLNTERMLRGLTTNMLPFAGQTQAFNTEQMLRELSTGRGQLPTPNLIGQARPEPRLGFVPRVGRDTEPALLEPGETVIPADESNAIATGSMSEDEIVRRIREHVQRPGGQIVEGPPQVEDQPPAPGAGSGLDLKALQHRIGMANARADLFASLVAGARNPRELANMQALHAQAVQERNSLLENTINAAAVSEAAVRDRLEQQRLAALDAERIRSGRVSEGQRERQLDLSERQVESLEGAREEATRLREEDPRRQALRTLLDPNADPEAVQRAVSALGRNVRDDTIQQILRIQQSDLSAQEKALLFSALPGVQGSVEEGFFGDTARFNFATDPESLRQLIIDRIRSEMNAGNESP